MPKTQHCVFIDQLRMETLIGIHDHEQITPQPLLISLWCYYNPRWFLPNEAYVCYDDLSQKITAYIHKNAPIPLVEEVAQALADIGLASRAVYKVRVKIDKLKAIKDTHSVGVDITVQKSRLTCFKQTLGF